jgi:chaperonin GroES
MNLPQIAWQPIGRQIVVKPLISASRTASGIVIPEASKERERPQTGIVIAVGPGACESGLFLPVAVDVGDLVAFGKYAGVSFVLDDGDEVMNMRDVEVLARKPKGTFALVEHAIEVGIAKRTVAHETGVLCDHCPLPERSAVLEEERRRLREVQ